MRTRLRLLLLFVIFAGPALAGPQDVAGGIYSAPATPLRQAPELESYAGGPAILILFQPDCAWCLKQFREAEAFVRQQPDIPVLAISLTGRRSALIGELRKARTHLPAYRSSPALLAQLGSPEGTPRTYLLSSDGTVRAAARGLQDRHNLDKLLKASDPSL